MDRTRLDFQLQQFRKALQAFEDAVRLDDGDKKSRDSILLSFVFTFEMAWRSVKAALDAHEHRVQDYAAAVFVGGFQAGFITDPDAWVLLRKNRNNVAHAYDEQKAIEIAAYACAVGARHFHDLLKRLEHDV